MITVFAPNHTIKTNIHLPASKSISNRMLIINALSYSPYEIENLADCDDTNVMAAALRSDNRIFDVKAAGTAMRFLTAFLSKIVGEWQITGTERMKQRPIKILVDALNSLGAKIEYAEKEGYPPLKIYGSSLQGGSIDLDGSVSSQYISALLMIAPTMEKGLKINLTGSVISKPYILMTLKLMEKFGIKSICTGNSIDVPAQSYRPERVKVESDWSAASYWYEIAALSENAEIELSGLHSGSCQGDAEVARIFKNLGIKTIFLPEGVRLQKTGEICSEAEYNFVEQPDLAQTAAITCAFLNIPFKFTGLQSLRIKETDRIAALKTELKRTGYLLNDSEPGTLSWNGERCDPENDPVIRTYEDHRMAMAFAPIALKTKSIHIADPGVVSKSYPGYWNDLKTAGFIIR
ncbi:MAG: 3-phosphoshikimate 1-carboxyvinyltransferase [Candidatus Azobacteroides sp.]|nr:3-phosphoshikimate 1-carboxyvinyltransferase [Candidatus Azobacteroides sp.]